MQAQVTPLLVLEDTVGMWGETQVSMGLLLHCTPITLLEEGDDDKELTLEPLEIFAELSRLIDPVRGWRALHILEALPRVEDRFFFLDLFIATERDEPDDTYHQRIQQEMRAKFEDPHTYDEIMSRAVPMTILQLVIQMADAGMKDLHLVDITDEIDQGTVRWSQELKRIGVEHPDHRRAVMAAKARIVMQYTNDLFSYAAQSRHPYDHDHGNKSWIMLIIEWRLYQSIEKGIEHTYGTDIVVMLAILMAEIEYDTVQEQLEKVHLSLSEGCTPFKRASPEHVIDGTIAWFFNSFRDKPSATRSQESCRELLQQLFQQWDQLPITHPGLKCATLSPGAK